MIEAYWNEVFGEFKNPDGKFDIPGFPEPLMSAHFGVKNIVGKFNGAYLQKFKLCIFDSEIDQFSYPDVNVRYVPLEKVLASDEFWRFHNKNNASGAAFMKRLLPFLVARVNSHWHFSMVQNENIVVSGIVGRSTSGLFLFNLSVDSEHRRKGMALQLLEHVRLHFNKEPLFYWTTHDWFILNGRVLEYTIAI